MPSSYVVGSHFEQFIKNQISGGRYASASEVVRDALRLLEHEEQCREAALVALQADVRIGLESGTGQSAETVFQRLEQKYSNHASVLVEP
ncbi:type II toxin-antitoxin system ParD family antitoxin [Synechococcus lacustris]|uniref:Type II toxin-antitoxin system ParD family antitoxin n=1 Tax=Synechococcus lacustris str. Tous TaxID=1910958 RepID=A0A2P7EBA7_9SYNE|nr:type II toxin-antitoxin system ParD family antitoxin [Synechococcus lacustris]PSI00512.1 type II toxin-antitoxin system ParD family antitoxin [Synechococcus lacustris str. Tous]